MQQNNDPISRRIRISASFNRAAEIVAAQVSTNTGIVKLDGDSLAKSIDILARMIYAKETAFEEELMAKEDEYNNRCQSCGGVTSTDENPISKGLHRNCEKTEFFKAQG